MQLSGIRPCRTREKIWPILWAHAVRAQHCAWDYGLGPRPVSALARMLDFYLLLPVQVEEDEDEGGEHPEDHEDTDDERADQLVFAEKRRTCEKSFFHQRWRSSRVV